MSGESATDLATFPFGPFHRVESPSQTVVDASTQVASGEVWGRVPFGSAWPQVQAYRGRLPEGVRGIEFWTEVPPDPSSHPSEARWSARGRPDSAEVKVDGDIAKIRCTVKRNTQGR